jgi:hypothetical protein
MSKKKEPPPTPAERDRALLQAVRQRHALSQWRLGQLLGVHYVTVSRWESRGGLTPWHRALLAKLQEAKPQALPEPPVEALAVLLASAYELDRPRPAPAPLPPLRRPLALPAPEAQPEPGRFGRLEID